MRSTGQATGSGAQAAAGFAQLARATPGRRPDQARPELRRTALHDAATAGLSALCRELLSQGADPGACDIAGLTAADLARQNGHRSLARLLDIAAAERRPAAAPPPAPLGIRELHGLSRNDPRAIERLIAEDRLAAVDAKGNAPLHIAARLGNLRLCDQLIRAGADPLQRNLAQEEPGTMARAAGHPEIAALLERFARPGMPPPEVAPPEAVPDVRPEPGPVAGVVAPAVPVPTIFPPDFANGSARLPDSRPLPEPAPEAAPGPAFEDIDDFAVAEDPLDFHTARPVVQVSAPTFRVEGPVTIRSGLDEEEADWSLDDDFGDIVLAPVPTTEEPRAVAPPAVPLALPAVAVEDLLLDHVDALLVTLRMANLVLEGEVEADFISDAPLDRARRSLLSWSVTSLEAWVREGMLAGARPEARRHVERLCLSHDYLRQLSGIARESDFMAADADAIDAWLAAAPTVQGALPA